MRKAFKKLREKGLDKSSNNAVRIMDALVIDASDLYVMYSPPTVEAEALLRQDSTLILADYPLDYDYTQEELIARPALLEGEIPDYYAAIKINSEQASEQSYILLDELYIPEEDPYFTGIAPLNARTTDSNIIESKEDLLRHLLYEAYKLTGNEAELDQVPLENGRWIFGTRWWPSGRITLFDEVVGANVPVVGAQVLIRQWFTVRQGITDANGNFSTSSVRGSARYILQWERYHYSIRNGAFFQAEHRGSKETNVPWNVNFASGDDLYHALIHQAAHDYYYGHRFGLTSPSRNGFEIGSIQMKIAARETAPWGVASSYSHGRSDYTGGLIAQITIKAYGNAADLVYGTTIHELTHASHAMVDRDSYNNLVWDGWIAPIQPGVKDNNRRTLETWARTVEIAMTLHKYSKEYAVIGYSYFRGGRTNYQLQTTLQENHYTSAGYDMFDDFNQRTRGTQFPIDRVSGYTLKQLEDGLIGARSWTQWRNNIKKKFDNPTEQFVDELFNNWPN